MQPQERHKSTLYIADVRQIAQALGIDVSPDEYVELVDSDGRMAGRVTVKVTHIEDLRSY